MIPIAVYITIDIVNLIQVFFINADLELYDEKTDTPMNCRALNIHEDLGQISYIFSDKTGIFFLSFFVFLLFLEK